MRWGSLIVYLSSIVISIGLANGCGKKKEGDVTITVSPGEPPMFTNDYTSTKDDTTISYKAPWFQARYDITNNTESTITITGIRYSYSYRGTDNQIVRSDQFSIGIGNCFIANELTDNIPQYLGQRSYDGECKAATEEGTDANPNHGTAQGQQVFIDSLPTDGRDFEFTVELLGWKGSRIKPEGNFKRSSVVFKLQEQD